MLGISKGRDFFGSNFPMKKNFKKVLVFYFDKKLSTKKQTHSYHFSKPYPISTPYLAL
jgi:hypothetical protein